MKKALSFTLVAGFMFATLISLIGCGDTSQKHATDAKENIKEAGEDLQKAAKASDEEAKAKAKADWQQFKNESDNSIAAMEKQIKDLKVKIANADKNRRDKLNSELNKTEKKLYEQKERLKQESIEFEADLERFDEAVVAKHESFRREFKHDMDELGTTVKDLFRDNVN